MDCGPHFRSYRVLSSIIMYNASLKLDTSLNYLPECHAKSIIDGFFAKMNGVMQQGALRKWITTIDEANQVFLEAAAEQHELSTDAAKEHYYKFEPPAKDAVQTWLFDTKSLNGLIKTTYSWDAKVDRNRKQLIGRGMNAFTVTAITVGARKLTDSPLDGRPSSPELSVDGVGDEHDEEAANRTEPLEVDTYLWKGWRMSYRKVEPEKDGHAAVRGRLKAKSDKLYDAVPQIAQRRKPIQILLANRASVMARKAKVQKSVKAAAAAYRI